MSISQTYCRTIILENGEDSCVPCDEDIASIDKKLLLERSIPYEDRLLVAYHDPQSELDAKRKLEHAKARFQSANVFSAFIR